MAILKVDTITSADTPTVSITDGASISGVTTFSSDINIADKIIHTGDTNTALRFPSADVFTAETGGTERLRCDSDGVKTLNGRFYSAGTYSYIESSSDTYSTLTLRKTHSDADSIDYLQCRDNSNTIKLTISGDGTLKIIDSIVHEGDTNTKIRFPAADTITAETSGSERLRITAGGLVGIGTDTSASSAKLQLVEPDSTEVYMQIANQTTGYDGNSGLLIGYNGSEVAKIMNMENTGMDIATNGNNRISIANDGHVTLSNAISFNAETATANRLDDYEEGTWTGVIATGGGTVSSEWYTKIGNIVFVSASLSAWGDTTSSTAITVTGLPFTCSTTGFGKTKWCKHADAHKGPWCEADGTTVRFLKSSTSTGSCDYMYHSGIAQSSGSAAFSLWYNVA